MLPLRYPPAAVRWLMVCCSTVAFVPSALVSVLTSRLRLYVAVSLFSATQPIYASTLSVGYAEQDTGAVCGVLEKMAGVNRKKKKKAKNR